MSTKIPIEKGVPIPTERNASTKFPFHELAVGDSFEVQNQNSVFHSAVSMARVRTGFTLVCRKTGPGSYRVWRTV